MPSLKSALPARLLAITSVSDLVGDRIHWSKVPQNSERPHVRLQVISDPRPEDLKSYHSARVTRVQADVMADRSTEVEAVSEAIIAALAQPATVGGVKFGRTKAEGPRDLGEESPDGFIHRASMDLLVEHSLA